MSARAARAYSTQSPYYNGKVRGRLYCVLRTCLAYRVIARNRHYIVEYYVESAGKEGTHRGALLTGGD